MPYFLILVLLGIAPAVIAYGKGRSFALWWIYGAALAPVAFIHALMLNKSEAAGDEPDSRIGDRDSPMPLMLKCVAIIAIAITGYVGYRAMITPETGMSGGASGIASLPPAPTVDVPQANVTEQAAGTEMPADEGNSEAGPRQVVSLPAAKGAQAQEASGIGSPPTSIPNVNETMPRAHVETSEPASQPESARKPDPAETVAEAPPQARAGSESAKASARSDPNSDVTAVGEIVRLVQEALAKRGYDPGAPSGRADARTRDAIRNFQVDHKLQQTGAIDYSVLRALDLVGPQVYAFKRPHDIPPGR